MHIAAIVVLAIILIATFILFEADRGYISHDARSILGSLIGALVVTAIFYVIIGLVANFFFSKPISVSRNVSYAEQAEILGLPSGKPMPLDITKIDEKTVTTSTISGGAFAILGTGTASIQGSSITEPIAYMRVFYRTDGTSPAYYTLDLPTAAVKYVVDDSAETPTMAISLSTADAYRYEYETEFNSARAFWRWWGIIPVRAHKWSRTVTLSEDTMNAGLPGIVKPEYITGITITLNPADFEGVRSKLAT